MKNRKKNEIYGSIDAFERRFFPKAFKKRTDESLTDAHAIGVIWAEESLEKMRRHLAGKKSITR